MPKMQLNILIEPDDLASLDRIADKMALTRSEVARNMIRECIPAYSRTSRIINEPLVKAVLKVLMAGDADAQMTLERLYKNMQREGQIVAD